jgi:hypothetical protein
MKVGPKALAKVIPDVRASCAPMIAAAEGLTKVTEGTAFDMKPVGELGRLVAARMTEFDRALGKVRSATLRASDRLGLETLVGRIITDLDGARELMDLLAEASATSSVPVDVTDVIRESAARPDATGGRTARAIVSFADPASAVLVKANPRLAMRLLAFAVAFAVRRDGVNISIAADADRCTLSLSAGAAQPGGRVVLTPAVIDLSLPFVIETANSAGARLTAEAGSGKALLSFPLAAQE